MLPPAKKLELARVSILSVLAEPGDQNFGGTLPEISGVIYARDKGKHADRRDRGKELFSDTTLREKIFPEMIAEGLIAVADPVGASRPKVYRITDQGSLYLKVAQERAMSTAPGQRQDWAKGSSGNELQEELTATLRNLPEFRDSGDARIREVGGQLAQAVTRAASR